MFASINHLWIWVGVGTTLFIVLGVLIVIVATRVFDNKFDAQVVDDIVDVLKSKCNCNLSHDALVQDTRALLAGKNVPTLKNLVCFARCEIEPVGNSKYRRILLVGTYFGKEVVETRIVRELSREYLSSKIRKELFKTPDDKATYVWKLNR